MRKRSEGSNSSRRAKRRQWLADIQRLAADERRAHKRIEGWLYELSVIDELKKLNAARGTTKQPTNRQHALRALAKHPDFRYRGPRGKACKSS